MWRSLLALVLGASAAWAQEPGTAYDALKTVGSQLNRSYLSRVISVTGADGTPQPETWRIIIADRAAPAGVREVVISNGQIVSSGSPAGAFIGSAAGATINTARLNLDSSGAFTVANYTADKSNTPFALVNYTLRTNERGSPVWVVALQDERRRPVGTIHISAHKGNVTRVEGMYRGADMAHVEQDPVPRSNRRHRRVRAPEPDEAVDEVHPDDADTNPVKAEIKRMFRRTKRDATRLFERVHRSFDDFIDRVD